MKNILYKLKLNLPWIFIAAILITAAVFFHRNIEFIIQRLNSFEIYSFLGFLLLYSTISIFCIPIPLVALAGGAVFGLIWGTILNIVGAIIAASCGFYLSRLISTRKYQQIKNDKVQKVIHQTEKMGWKSIALLRITPTPFHFVNYSLGLTNIKFKQFIIISAIFLIPKTLILTFSGFYGSNLLKDISLQHLNLF